MSNYTPEELANLQRQANIERKKQARKQKLIDEQQKYKGLCRNWIDMIHEERQLKQKLEFPL